MQKELLKLAIIELKGTVDTKGIKPTFDVGQINTEIANALEDVDIINVVEMTKKHRRIILNCLLLYRQIVDTSPVPEIDLKIYTGLANLIDRVNSIKEKQTLIIDLNEVQDLYDEIIIPKGIIGNSQELQKFYDKWNSEFLERGYPQIFVFTIVTAKKLGTSIKDLKIVLTNIKNFTTESDIAEIFEAIFDKSLAKALK